MLFSNNKNGWLFPALKTLGFAVILFFTAKFFRFFIAWGDRERKPPKPWWVKAVKKWK
jgi:hypothetical protein